MLEESDAFEVHDVEPDADRADDSRPSSTAGAQAHPRQRRRRNDRDRRDRAVATRLPSWRFSRRNAQPLRARPRREHRGRRSAEARGRRRLPRRGRRHRERPRLPQHEQRGRVRALRPNSRATRAMVRLPHRVGARGAPHPVPAPPVRRGARGGGQAAHLSDAARLHRRRRARAAAADARQPACTRDSAGCT